MGDTKIVYESKNLGLLLLKEKFAHNWEKPFGMSSLKILSYLT